MKLRIVSDKFNQRTEIMNNFSFEEIPIDLYGKRVFPTGKDNIQKAAEDIREYYGLTGKDGLKGGE
jgi:hypothetical protein